MKFALVLAFCITAIAGTALAGTTASTKIQPATAELTEFTLSQNLSIETLTCKTFFLQADFQFHGQLNGVNCVATGPVFQTGPSVQGHTHVEFDIPTQGQHIAIDGCRVDSQTALPGYYHYAINCT